MNPNNKKLFLRKASPQDSDIICLLIYEASKPSVDFNYTLKDATPLEFIKYCFKSGKGFFGYKKQTICILNEKIVFTATSYKGTEFRRLAIQTIQLSYKYHGWINATKILIRSLRISHLFIEPQKESIYLANICTDINFRGTGIFKYYFNTLTDTIKSEPLAQIELDVSYDNENALNVYKKLGFKITENRDYIRKDKKFTGTRRMEYIF